MYYLVSFVLILVGLSLAFYGSKKYNISLALTYVISNSAILYFIDDALNGLPLIRFGYYAILISGVFILFFAKIFTYIYSFTAFWFLIALVWASFYTIFDIEVKSFEGLVISAISLIAVILLRKLLKELIIGFGSGLMIGLGVASIGFRSILNMGWGFILDSIYFPSITIVVFTIAGVLFQKYLRESKMEAPKLNTKQVYQNFGGGAALLSVILIFLPMLLTSSPQDNGKKLAEEYCNCLTNAKNIADIEKNCKEGIGYGKAVRSISSVDDILVFSTAFNEYFGNCFDANSISGVDMESLLDFTQDIDFSFDQFQEINTELEQSVKEISTIERDANTSSHSKLYDQKLKGLFYNQESRLNLTVEEINITDEKSGLNRGFIKGNLTVGMAFEDFNVRYNKQSDEFIIFYVDFSRGNLNGVEFFYENNKLSAVILGKYGSASTPIPLSRENSENNLSKTDTSNSNFQETINLNTEVERNLIHCENDQHIIKIDYLLNSDVRFVSWKKPKTTNDPPTLMIYNGAIEPHGSAGGETYKFRKGEWEYILENNIMGETIESIGLFFTIKKDGEFQKKIKFQDLKLNNNYNLDSYTSADLFGNWWTPSFGVRKILFNNKGEFYFENGEGNNFSGTFKLLRNSVHLFIEERLFKKMELGGGKDSNFTLVGDGENFIKHSYN